MKISKIETFVIKSPVHDRFGAQTAKPRLLPNSDYYQEAEWREFYSQRTEALLVRVETDEGLWGWGESQSPLVPEAARTIIDRLLAPMLLGCDPRQTSVLWDRMYHSMNVRGQVNGFMLDAISGLDIALWDVKGKAAGQSIASLLGGPFCTRIPLYVSGLRAATRQKRAGLAQQYLAQGFRAVKLFSGKGMREDIAEARAIRERVGTGKGIFCDLLCRYNLPEAQNIGHALEELDIGWIESPLAPEDVRGHAKLAEALQLAVAAGEALRTRYQFLDWFEKRAIDIAQPDVARSGITEGKRIADLASAWHIPIAYHLGVSMGVAIVATWQLAAATPNLYIVEHEPPMFELSARFFKEPPKIEKGMAVLPDKPGLGVDVDLNAISEFIQ